MSESTAQVQSPELQDGKIACQICGEKVHAIQTHLKNSHTTWDLDGYRRAFPAAPIFSQTALDMISKKKGGAVAMETAAPNVVSLDGAMKRPLAQVFELKSGGTNAQGKPIPITVCGSTEWDNMVPHHRHHVWGDAEFLKNILMGMEMNFPTYLWGHTGTGKTTAILEVCHKTHRPAIRVQHTANMEESDITGRWVVRNGETIFDLGPLPLAMRYGWVYIADEYDFAFPNVLSVYQAVLEGEPLVIKEADVANRVIEPHPNFRFFATGNTNGSGDETGLYSGTNMQNAANYSRFALVVKAEYMPKKDEVKMLKDKTGILESDAERLVNFAHAIREAFEGGNVGMTIGPRELLYAALIGSRKDSFRAGVRLTFSSKLSKVDFETVEGIAQRYL